MKHSFRQYKFGDHCNYEEHIIGLGSLSNEVSSSIFDNISIYEDPTTKSKTLIPTIDKPQFRL